jgi:hypothetical protein
MAEAVYATAITISSSVYLELCRYGVDPEVTTSTPVL